MPYQDQDGFMARVYDADYAALRTPSGDVAFYVDEAVRSGGPVLELGCGTGRILVPTAEAGIEIEGLDASPAMLARARVKLESRGLVGRLHEGDMREFELERRFRLVTIPFRALAHVEEAADHVRVFENVRRHLAPDGRFVFDFFHPRLDMLAVPWGEKLDIERQEGGRTFRRYARGTPDRVRQVTQVDFRWEIEDGDGRVEEHGVSFGMRWFHRFELEHLIARCGLRLDAIYGNFDRTPLDATSPEMIFVCRPA